MANRQSSRNEKTLSLAIHRKTRFACAATVIAAAASLALAAAPMSDAARALSIGATGSALQNQHVRALQSWQYTHNFWGDDPDGVVTEIEILDYPSLPVFMNQSIQIGAAALDAKIRSLEPGEMLMIVGESQGKAVISYLFNKYAGDPTNAPDLSNVVVVSVGDPTAPTGFGGKNPGGHIPIIGFTSPGSMPTTVRGYSFVRELDFFAYTPNNLVRALLDPVVAANYFASFLQVHPHYGHIDPDNLSPNTWVKKDGEVTYYVIEERVAPALAHMEAGFKALGLGAVFNRLNKGMLAHIRPYYNQNLEGFVRLDSLPTAEPDVSDQRSIAEVPITASMSLRGSLPSELQQASSASSDDAEGDSNKAADELKSTSEEVKSEEPASVLPDPTPEVVNEQEPSPTTEEQKQELTLTAQDQPQANLSEGVDDTKEPEADKLKQDDDNDSSKTSLKSGEGVKRTVVGSHNARTTVKSANSDDSKKPSVAGTAASSSSNSGSTSDG